MLLLLHCRNVQLFENIADRGYIAAFPIEEAL